jgi:hypothetical protein
VREIWGGSEDLAVHRDYKECWGLSAQNQTRAGLSEGEEWFKPVTLPDPGNVFPINTRGRAWDCSDGQAVVILSAILGTNTIFTSMGGSHWILYPVTFLWLILILTLHCLDYCCLIKSLKSGSVNPLAWFF